MALAVHVNSDRRDWLLLNVAVYVNSDMGRWALAFNVMNVSSDRGDWLSLNVTYVNSDRGDWGLVNAVCVNSDRGDWLSLVLIPALKLTLLLLFCCCCFCFFVFVFSFFIPALRQHAYSPSSLSHRCLFIVFSLSLSLIIIMQICRAPTLWLKALNKQDITYLMYME